ncbi:hypothetical protein [Microbacterium gilvum]|uniref:Uncharacterized protein n=1 Tax=Microbacterium gilvum TaxID=1336204 RepID=A0ABP8ZPJ8_9MICO
MIHPDDLPEGLRDELLGQITPEMQAKQDAAMARIHARIERIRAETAADTERTPPLDDEMKELAVWAAIQRAPDHLRPAEAGAEARRRWEAWLTAHDDAVRQEEREKAAHIAEISYHGDVIAYRIREQGR